MFIGFQNTNENEFHGFENVGLGCGQMINVVCTSPAYGSTSMCIVI